MKFETLPGFREFYPQQCALRNHVFGLWRRVAHTFGFEEYDAPILEPLDLYIEKSGEEIVGQLFNFEDRGGRAVAMRPEMTPSLARMIGAKANSLKRPIKWFSAGEFYRYERPQKGRLRAFYQFNVDIFGEPGPAADAELITLLCRSLESFGLTGADFKVRLSDRNLWFVILSGLGLDADQSAQILQLIDKIERMDRSDFLKKLESVTNTPDRLLEQIEEIIRIRDYDTMKELVASLDLSHEDRSIATRRLEDWASLLKLAKATGIFDYIQIDFGIVRGLAYYTGFVFEAFEATGQGRALAGGGRYDELVKKLGGPDMPAVGFAMGDVTLIDLLTEKNLLPAYHQTPEFICIMGGEEERLCALHDANQIRALGYRVDYPLKDYSFGKQFKAASQSGARYALVYGSDELEQNSVKVRDLSSGEECDFPRDQLVKNIPDLIQNGLT